MNIPVIAPPAGGSPLEMRVEAVQGNLAAIFSFHLKHPIWLAVLVSIALVFFLIQQLAKVSKPFATLHAGINRVLHAIGNFQARIILTILYGIIVLPFGLAARLFSDPLRVKHPPKAWLDHTDETMDVEWAKRQ